MSALENKRYPIEFTRPDGWTEPSCFCGTVIVPQMRDALLSAIDPGELIRRWNRICPFQSEGEQWALIQGGFAFATVERYPGEGFVTIKCDRKSLSPYCSIQAVRITETPPPAPGVKRGWWKTDLPTGSGSMHIAELYVEYFSTRMKWVFSSTTSHEVGPMGPYENDDHIYIRENDEKEFPDRESLLRALMDFVPRVINFKSHPDAQYHSVSAYVLTDDILYSLVDRMFC